MAKKERLKASLRFYVVYAICILTFLVFTFLVYLWQLWSFANIKAMDPLQLAILLLLSLMLLASILSCAIVSGYRRHLKNFHKVLFDAQTKPKQVETKSGLKELRMIAQGLNKVLDVWDKQFKLKEKELKKDAENEKQKLLGIWENLSDGVILVDTHFNVVFINQAIKRTLGDIVEDVRCFEYLENSDKPCELCPLQEALKTNKPQKIIKQLRDINGQKCYFECTAAVISDHNNNPLGGLILLKDVSRWMEMDLILEEQSKELDHTRQRLEETLGKLNVARAKLEESDKFVSLGLFAANIVNEITNPVNFIQESVQIMSEHTSRLLRLFEAYKKLPLMPRARSEIDRIEQVLNVSEIASELDKSSLEVVKSAQSVKEIVQSLITFLQPAHEKQTVDLRKLIEDALAILSDQYKERIQILKYFDDIPKIVGSPNKLVQLFTNIIRNSIQAIEGFGEIVITTRRIDNRAVVEITDTGRGFSPETLATIFDPFVAKESSSESIGLGLAIAKTIVEEHKGNISVQSELNKGTKFVIEFPAIC